MSIGVVNYSKEYVEKLIYYLNSPDLFEPEQKKSSALWNLGSKLYTGLTRAKQAATAGVWYDEPHARQLLLDYINNPDCKKKLSDQHQKIMQIYDRLAHLKKGGGTWADGIDKELLLAHEQRALVEEEPVHELESLILENVLIPDFPEEQVFAKKEETAERRVDPRGVTYIFTHLTGLEPPTHRQLFHIEADEFGSSSELEGGQSDEMVKYLHRYLERQGHYSPALLKELDNVVNMAYVGEDYGRKYATQEYVKTAQKKMGKAFDAKEPLLIIGGWTGQPSGHAIYYEVIPETAGKATLRLYNTGAGIEAHQESLVGHKVKYQAYTEWKGIDRKRLESNYFLEALYELKSHPTLPSSSTLTQFGAADVYQGLRALLQPEKESEVAQSVDLLMSPQRAGVCSWKSLMAFLRTKIDLNDYKRFKCDMKLQALLDYVDSYKGEVKAQDWRLVRKSHQNLSRAILQLHQRKLVGDAYLQKAQEVLKPVSEWLKSHAECRFKRPVEAIPSRYAPSPDDRFVENRHVLGEGLDQIRKSEESERGASQPFHNMAEAFQKVKDFKQLIGLANQAWEMGEDTALYQGLVTFIKQLEMDESFWKQSMGGDAKKSEELIRELGQIALLFTKSCFTVPAAHIIFSEKIYVMHKILALQAMICRLGHPDPAFWGKLGAEDVREESLFLSYPDAKMQQEMKRCQVELYKNRVSINFYNRSPTKHYQKMGLELEFKPEREVTAFFKYLREQFPDVVARVVKEEPKFNQLPQVSQDAHLYASAHLPEWMKAMRDAELAYLYLTKANVGPLTTLNRTKDLTPQFQIEDKKDSATVTIAWSGVTGDILKNPNVKKIDIESTLRYAGSYRPIVNPAIQKIIAEVGYHSFPREEKELAATHAKALEIEMPDEAFKELARLFGNKKELQLIETLAYFTKHPEKLQESDYQTLFHVILFSQGLLEANLALGDRLAQFIQRNYEQFSEENEIPTAVFLLKVAHQLQSFFPKQEFYQRSTEALKTLLQRKGLETDVKALIYGELLAQLGKKKTLSAEEMALLIAGAIFVEENQPHSKYPEDPVARKEGREALTVHAKALQNALEQGKPNQALLNHVLTLLRGKSDRWVMKVKTDEFPQFATEDGSQMLYPLLARLVSAEGKALLPINIRTNPLFQQLFPNVEEGSYGPGNVFSFKDSQGVETLVSLKGDQLVVDQKMGEKWFRFIPAEAFLDERESSGLGSRFLVHHYTHWQALDGTGTIFGLENGQRKFQIQAELVPATAVQKRMDQKWESKIAELRRKYSFGWESVREHILKDLKEEKADPTASYFIVKEVQQLGTGLQLGRSSALFQNFEDPAYIHEWFDLSGQLQKIELPRFKLSFVPKGETLICEQFPTFMLNQKEPVKAIGSHHHYLILEDGHKRRKVLLPQQSLKAPQEKEVLQPRYQMDRALKREEREAQKYLVFDLQKGGTLFSKSREANLYLAEVLTAAQEYKQAAYYLKKFGEKLSSYTPAEAKALEEIARMDQISGDKSGNGTALQLYADYLLVKNSLGHHKEASLDSINSHYDQYISQFSNVTVFKLKPSEEIFILKSLLQKEFQVLHYLRLKELDPAAAQNVAIPPQMAVKELKAKTLEGFEIPQRYVGFADIPHSHILLTRPQEAMSLHFPHFYEMARQGKPEERERLKASLPFLRPQNPGLANFFEAVLAEPTAYPPPLREGEREEFPAWKTKLTETAAAYLAKQAPEIGERRVERVETWVPLEEAPRTTPFQPKLILPPLPQFSESARPYFHETAKQRPSVEGLRPVLEDCVSEDPVQNREVERLKKDVDHFEKSPPEPVYTADLNSIVALLSKDKELDREAMATLEKEILAVANKESPFSQLQKWGGQRKVISLDELLVHFATQDFQGLFQRNPALEEADLALLVEKIGLFLLHSTRNQQRERAEAVLQKPEDLAHELLTKRRYDPAKRPAFLVFEYFANLSMRPAQVEKLEKFLETGDANLVMEMIMGSGKSKVLLPLLGLLRADGKTLSMLIVPQPLFESVSQDTQRILNDAFSQRLSSLHFDRHTAFTKERLEAILDDLKSIQKNRECLIMTSKSVQCLLLKFIEGCAQEREGEFSPELKLMQKILNLIRQSGHPIIDEADTVLNVLHEVSFSGGSRLTPKPEELELLSDIYGIIYENPEIRKLARLESDPSPDPKAPVLTEQLYLDVVQRPLAEALIKRLGARYPKIVTLDSKLLLHYLCRTNITQAQKFFDGLDEETQNIVALAGEQISHLLPYTLTRICDEKYGLDEKSKEPFAIPFSAANTPSSGSQFSNAYITMNYTFQTFMKKGVTSRMVEDQIKLLQEKAMREIAASGGKIGVKESEGGKAFATFKGPINMPLFNYKSANLEELVAHLNQNPAAKRLFVASVVLPQLEHFEYKMSCNPQNLVALFGKVSGFTGTLWNGNSMHHSLQPEPEIGTDAKTLGLLWEKCQSNAISIKEGSVKEMLAQLQNVPYDMISDAGGYFKAGSNSAIAHEMASRGKETVFYNAKGEQSITEHAEEISLTQSNKPVEERMTFLDQSHTTGADVAQKRDALGLVTIGRNMLLRDLLQAVWRLRGLDKSQSVRFVISEEVAGIMRQKLNLPVDHPLQLQEILKFAISNQASQQGRDNNKGLKEGLANIPQGIYLETLLNEKLLPKARFQASLHLQPYWIKPAAFSPRERYGQLTTEMKSEQVLKADCEQWSAKVKELFKKMPWLKEMGLSEKQYLDEINEIADRVKDALPATLQVPEKEIEDDQTVEVEREAETETAKETELEVQEASQPGKIVMAAFVGSDGLYECESLAKAVEFLRKNNGGGGGAKNLWIYHNFALKNKCPTFPLKTYLETDPALKPFASAFEGIAISFNVLEWEAGKENFQLLGSHRTDFHHLLVKGPQVTLMTQMEAPSQRESADYYNLTLGFHDPKKPLTQDQQFKIVKLKFLNGESQYSSDEIKLLKLWFKAQGVKRMQKLFTEHILKGYPQRAARYLDSPLQSLFGEEK